MNLIKLDQVENLSFDQIKNIFKKNINKSKTDFLTSFSFGRDKIKYAEGIKIYNEKDEAILDFTAGVGVLSHGHNHPRILKVRKFYQETKKMEVNKSFLSPYLAALSHNVSEILPGDLNYSFFPNSGSEAIDTALKTAFLYHNGKRKKIISSDIAFHGKNLSTIAVSSSPEINFNYPKFLDVKNFRFNDFSHLKEIVEKNRDDVASIIIEPISISTIRETSKEFLINCRKLCDEDNIVLIFDEIYSGWAKTGYLFNFMKVKNLVPDILCTAKSFGGGKSSISGVIFRNKIHEKCFENSKYSNLLSSTYYGFGEEIITAIEAINIIVEDDFVNKSREIEKKLNKILTKLKIMYPKEIDKVKIFGTYSGIFLNNRFELLKKILKIFPVEILQDKYFIPKLLSASIIDRLYERHKILSLISLSYDTHIILSPPHICNEKDLNNLEEALFEVFEYGVFNCVKDFVFKKLKTSI